MQQQELGKCSLFLDLYLNKGSSGYTQEGGQKCGKGYDLEDPRHYISFGWWSFIVFLTISALIHSRNEAPPDSHLGSSLGHSIC